MISVELDHTTVTSVRLLKQHPRLWPENYVYIGMPGPSAERAGITNIGPFGKPWACLKDPRGWQIAYREYLWNAIRNDGDFALAVRDLHGKVLVCWCKGKRPEHNGEDHCHGDTLAKAAEWLYHGMEAS